MAGRAIVLRFAGDTTSLERSFTKAGVASGQLESHTSRLRGVFSGMAAGAAGFAAVNFFKGSIDGARDLNESLNKTNVVFGKFGDSVIRWADDSAKKMGISKQKALEAVGTFGSLFVAMGIGKSEAAGMSSRLVMLASDLASFNNASPEEALIALRAGLVGESEPLRRFSVQLSAARVQAEALAIGLVKPTANATKIASAQIVMEKASKKASEAIKEHGKKSLEARSATAALQKAQDALNAAVAGSVPELTAAQKAQAAYSVIMKDTKIQQGDFANTSGGLANQQRILKAQFEDLQAKIGSGLLPIMTGLTKGVTGLFGALENLSPAGKKVVAVVTALAAAFTAYAIIQKFTAEGTILHTAAQAAAAVATHVWAGAQWLLNAALSANPIGIVVLAVAALTAAVVLAWRHSETFRNVVNTLGAAFVGTFTTIRDVVTAVVGWIIDRFRDLSKIMDKILGPIEATVGKIAGVIGKVAGVGGSIAKHIPGFAEGGLVPGPIGAPQLAVVHGGERVIPVGGGGGGGNVAVTVNVSGGGDGHAIARAVRDELIRLRQRNGTTGL